MTESKPDVFDRMKDEIFANASEKAKAILNRANQIATEILEDARIRAERISKDITEKTKKEEDLRLRRDIARTKLTARANILKSKEDLINEAFDTAWEKVMELVNSAKYTTYLNDSITEAAIGLGGGDLKVKTLEGHGKYIDAQQLQQVITQKTNTTTTLKFMEEDIRSIGGAIVINADETIRIDNTFEARLRRMKESIRTEIANILFE